MRAISIVLQFALGFVYGAVATFGHQATLTIAGATIPWGVIAATAGVLGLLISVRVATPGRTGAFVVALGLVAAVAMLSFPGPGGSVIIPGGIIGLMWTFTPTIVAILVVAWPEVRATPRPSLAAD